MEATAGGPGGGRGTIDVGRVIGRTFEIYSQHAVLLIGSAVLVFVCFGIVEGLLNDAGGVIAQILASMVHLVGVALYTGFVVKLVQDLRDGSRDSTFGELFSHAYPAIGALVINSILLGIAVVVGFLLLIVPGLILITIWAVCAPAIVVERKDAIAAFGRSRELVRGQGWRVFGTIVVAFLIQLVVILICTAIGAAIGGAGGLIVFSILGSALTAPVWALVSGVMFFELGGGDEPPEVIHAPSFT